MEIIRKNLRDMENNIRILIIYIYNCSSVRETRDNGGDTIIKFNI